MKKLKELTKPTGKTIIRLVEEEVEKLAKEWREDPYLWESETDIHAELYQRIKSSLSKRRNINTFSEKDREYFPTVKDKSYKGMIKEEYFNWIYCKPKISVRVGRKYCYPDIVIYKGLPDKKGTG